ncbi:MAG: ABC transporter permease subunit [Defluviitaleaceae bacterium]|nr:ABC transporter permease subunit [Defluviitaleaceae bacterium]
MRHKNHLIGDFAGHTYAWASIGLAVAVCLFIIGNVAYLGADIISLEFLTQPPPANTRITTEGGILTPMIGTIILTLLGILIALPISLSTALYLTWYTKKGIIKTIIESSVDVLAGVPTVVIGLFAQAVFTQPWLGFLSTRIHIEGGLGKAFGRSFFVAGIAMAIMILPFITKAIIESIKTTPKEFPEGSFALGATKWRTVTKIVLNSARPGIVTGVVLGMGRIISDTAIVWLALGGSLRMPGAQPWYEPQNWISTLQHTGSTLTTYIFFTSPAGEGSNPILAFGAAFVLIVIIIVLNAAVAAIGLIGANKVQK